MLRKVADIIRNWIVGPRLMTLARMSKNDMNQLALLAGNYYILVGNNAQPSNAKPNVNELSISTKEIDELREKISILTEKVDVLQRFISQTSNSPSSQATHQILMD